MRGKRFLHTMRLYTLLSAYKRTEYLKKHEIYGAIGEQCNIEDRIIPLYAKLIRIGNNVRLASHVLLVTHDGTHNVLNRYLGKRTILEKVGCIEIGDNVFVGSNSTILYNVKIGSNVIIGAGSLVNKDIPDNSVAAGVPAKVICRFDDFLEKRIHEASYPEEMKPSNQTVSSDLEKYCWNMFYEKRAKK